jgi:ubiquitin-protein ligase
MSEFIYYDLIDVTLKGDKVSKIDEDKLLKDVNIEYKNSESLFSRGEVAISIIKELYKVEEKYKKLEIIDLYNITLNDFCNKYSNITLKLTLDKDYYPMLTPDITFNPPIDPIYMYEMLSHPDLDIRNISRIKNINYIIEKVIRFLNDYDLECKLNYDITNNMLLLLKNNNFKMKLKETNTNINKINDNTNKVNDNGIGYGGKVSNWDVNAYLNNLVRIKETNEIILYDIVNYLALGCDFNKDLNEIHNKFNLNRFWIDLLEKYEVTDEKYYNSIKNIMYIINYLNLKIKIPFLDIFESAHKDNNLPIINIIKEYIKNIRIQEVFKNVDNQYVTILQKLQNGDYPYVSTEKHNFVKEISAFTNYNKNTTSKFISKQFEIISRSLPLTSESAIFFRKDPDNISIFKFAIIPNEDTPYRFGVFVFDVYIPQDFPNCPPVVNHITSKKNDFRFNPNLYANGYVCLSILGTWSGQSQSERWIPPNSEGTGSTLYQIIMSIYSMIFTEYPWYNEPGRESRKDAASNKYSVEYNKEIQDATIKYAILNQLKHPEEGFEDVIKEHFRFKKDKVISYLKELNKEKEQKIFEKYF